MSTLIKKPSHSGEKLPRRSAENLRGAMRTPSTGAVQKPAAANAGKEALIPDEWDTRKKGGVQGSVKMAAGSSLAVPDRASPSDISRDAGASDAKPGPEEISSSQEESTVSEGRRRSSSVRSVERTYHRRHKIDRRPDELNSEEEPFVKPGTMLPKSHPPQPQVPKETPITTAIKAEGAAPPLQRKKAEEERQTMRKEKAEEERQAMRKEPVHPFQKAEEERQSMRKEKAEEERQAMRKEKAEEERQAMRKEVDSPHSGRETPMSKTYPAMSEHEFLSRVGSRIAIRQQEPAVPKDPIRVLVTAVTTELSYRMLIPLMRGDVFGVDQPIVLHLYDESENISDMRGIAMEIEDCSFALLKQVVFTGEDEVAFLNVDVAFLNDSVPVDGDRALFEKCVQTYAGHGKALSAHAKKTVKVIVSGHPIHTNTYICIRYSKDIPYENFTGLARLNHNRAVTLLSQRLGVIPNKIVNMIVWGHRGDTLLPDYSRTVITRKARRYKITELVSREYLEEGLPEDVKIRDDLVQKLTKHPGILSRAKAACDQMRDWWIGLPAGQFVTMAVLSDGLYGVPPDLVFSYPVFIDNSRAWKVVQGITVHEKLSSCISESAKDLERERDEAMEICTELAL